MFINKKSLLFLIEAEVTKALVEQDEPKEDPAADAPASKESDAPSGADDVGIEVPGVPDGEGTENVEGAADGADATGIEGGLEGEEGVAGDAEGDMDDSFGDGGSGFGGGGGGGGLNFGDEGDVGLDADEEGEEDTVTTVGPEDVEIPVDPIMAITDDAIKLLNKTQQPSVILQNVKYSIQRYFSDPADATPIIKTLWDTEDLVLRDVARRLLLFITGA